MKAIWSVRNNNCIRSGNLCIADDASTHAGVKQLFDKNMLKKMIESVDLPQRKTAPISSKSNPLCS